MRAEYITIAKKLTESGTIIMNIHCLKLALRTTIPVFMGYISCGIAFGLVTVNAGYPWWLSPAMGIMMFAGAGQFFAMPFVTLCE